MLDKERILKIIGDMEYLVSMRNVLAHEYFDVTEESIYNVYKKISNARDFMEAVRTHINVKNKKGSR